LSICANFKRFLANLDNWEKRSAHWKKGSSRNNSGFVTAKCLHFNLKRSTGKSKREHASTKSISKRHSNSHSYTNTHPNTNSKTYANTDAHANPNPNPSPSA
jgi:hypothetical protein